MRIRAAITAWLAALTTLLPTSSGPRGSRSASTPPYSLPRQRHLAELRMIVGPSDPPL
ncbi:hypothetical protein RFN57_00655 [Streptomyces violaceochromogenes]|uniref:Uncharacterized protein n=1 Tax=Streptomyces violaceochromogenes TaxID=67377 RepID=A0ABU6LMY0_9ACTN|nr:hypothetical protein [Streptomyces violaceochromogenes]MEC7050833.1 hypothetical protein [Streptomyces violaceochromogenes]